MFILSLFSLDLVNTEESLYFQTQNRIQFRDHPGGVHLHEKQQLHFSLFRNP